MLKRLFDLMVSLIALAVLALPFLIVMLILRLTAEGQVWYFQPRVGYLGRHFQVFKFCTMRKGSEFTATRDITLRNDPRVTPIGRFLRKGKINELPQIINVLKGDMSIVGPRPLMPRSFEMYPPHVQERIVRLRPGLTGIGSIVFRDEEAIVEASDLEPRQVYEQIIAPYKGELELWYQDHQSFTLDLKIIFVTAWVVLFPESRIVQRLFRDLPEPPAAIAASRSSTVSAA